MAKRISKGVQDIKTVSGRVDGQSTPHRVYMRLSVLEMEKFRRGKEKQSALEKVSNIDRRFGEIETEKREILASMEGHGGQPGRTREPEEQTAPSPSRTGAGSFKIKY
jgi:hypothetical protein